MHPVILSTVGIDIDAYFKGHYIKPAREPYPEVQVTYDICMHIRGGGGTQINSVVHMRGQRNTKKGLFFETKCNLRES